MKHILSHFSSPIKFASGSKNITFIFLKNSNQFYSIFFRCLGTNIMTLHWNRHRSIESLDDETSVELTVRLKNIFAYKFI